MNQSSIFANLCPSCKAAPVFRSFFMINKNCPNCQIKFEKEEGYFFGPMIISYFLTLFLATPILLIMTFKYETDFTTAMLLVGAFVLLVGPILYRYSKLVWLHLESGFAQKMKLEQDRATTLKSALSRSENPDKAKLKPQ